MPLIALFSHPDPKKRTRYRVGAGIGISLLLHILFFTFFLLQSQTPKEQSQVKGDMPPLEVSFITQQPKPKAAPTPAPAPAPKAPTPPAPKTPPRKAAPPVKPAPVQEAIKQPEIAKLPPEADMSTMLNAARARRHAAEADAAQENAAARAAEGPKSANDIAKANIEFQANKKSGGQNGVFQILTKGPRVASYAFYGWTNQSRFSERQVFQVDAGSGGNVELAIVDSMIALIRKYYPGDFNWDSQRLGRVVILSARAADNAGLQNFLMQEFFGR